jgi:predicted PurR-regulated permease PerM
MQEQMKTEEIANKYVFAFFIMVLGIFLFLGLKEFFSAFLGAVVFYTLFKRLMFYLTKRRRFKKSLSAVIIIVISFIIVVLPMTILFTVIFNKISAIASQPDVIAENINKITERLEELPFNVSINKLKDGAQNAITQNAGKVLNSSLSILGSILMMYFFLFFLLVNTNRMEASIIYHLPFRRTKIMLFGRELVDQTYSNAIGVPLVCVAQGLLAYLAYRIANVPEAGLWGILTGFASIIPIVGTGIIWVPVTLFLLAEENIWQGLFVAAYSIVIMSNVDNLIRMVVSKKIGHVHPITTVLGVIIGLKFFGLPGLVFGPLIISYFMILLKLYFLEYIKPRGIPEPLAAKEKNILRALLDQLSFFQLKKKKL